MKTVPTALQNKLNAGEAQTLCQLWTITPRNSTTPVRLTDLDRDVTYGGNTYKSSAGFFASAVELQAGGVPGDVDTTILFRSGLIERDAVELGLYNDAEGEILIIDYSAPEDGAITEFLGVVRATLLPDNAGAVFTLRGDTGNLDRPLTEVYTATCRADFGDARCGIDIDAHKASFEVVGATGNVFTSDLTDVDGHYALGTVAWLTGANAGLAQEVAQSLQSDGTVTLYYSPKMPIQAGDTGTIYRGCAKTVAACKAYANILNFRGEPYIPGPDFRARVPAPTED